MKKFTAKTVISVMSFTIFAFFLAESFMEHKQEIGDSIQRLMTTLKPEKPAEETQENTEEAVQTASEGDTANG
jgi:ABC-type transport system involved in cytochrome bd biosynthesis fused ATPase/permease subunit